MTASEISTLVFTPVKDGSGSGYGSFTYTVNDGLQDAASANTMKVNIGDAVDVNVKSWTQATDSNGNSVYPPVASKTLTLKDDQGATVSGSFSTNALGAVSYTHLTLPTKA